MALLYGYAFRRHWFWHNQYKGGEWTYVIWKDYHCITWVSFKLGDATTQSSVGNEGSIISEVDGALANIVLSMTETPNIWELNKMVVELLEDVVSLGNTFSGVGVWSAPAKFGAYFCVGAPGMWISRLYTIMVSVNGKSSNY